MTQAATQSLALPRRSLAAQFVRLLLLPLTLAFMLAAAGTVAIGYGVERSAQEKQRHETVDIYAQSLSKPLWDCDSATAQGIVDTLAYLPTVGGVALKDICAGSILTGGQIVLDSQAHADLIQREVVYRDERGTKYTVGEIQVEFRPVSIVNAAMAILWRYVAIFIVMLVVMLAGAALAFHKIVGLPLGRFRSTIDRHIANDQDAMQDNSPIHGRNDELADVMSAYGDLMAELDLRFTRQETLAQCASNLLAGSPGNNDPLTEVLASVLKTVAADHIYLALADRNSEADLYPATRGSSEIYRPRYQRWLDQFLHHHRIAGPINDLPASEREDLQSHGICSLAAVPVWGQSNWYGFICVQDLQHARHWSESEQIFLQTTADMIGAFLESEKHKLELASAIEKLRDNEKALIQIARHDPLTGLGNRIVVEEKIADALVKARHSGLSGHLLLIDLDNFKPINDTYGHSAGDFVLQEIARRLLATMRRSDTVARIGGDEFLLITEASQSPSDVPTLINKLSAAIAAPIIYDGQILTVGSSIGAARYPSDGTSSVALMARADQIMYKVKQSRRAPLESSVLARISRSN